MIYFKREDASAYNYKLSIHSELKTFNRSLSICFKLYILKLSPIIQF